MLPLAAGLCLLPSKHASGFEARGGQFIGFPNPARFESSRGDAADEFVLTAPVVTARIDWDELIVSWDAAMPEGSGLKVEARAVYPDRPTKFYVMGLWSADTNRHPRESVLGQKDEDASVATDTLILKQPTRRFQVRLTLRSELDRRPAVRFLGVCLADSRTKAPPLPPNRAAWGRTIDVPQRSQMVYPGGDVWCSPTTTSMLLAHWSKILKRPELDCSVPQVVAGVFDRNWDGTGNWVFNTAFAGSFRGLRAYVTRFSDVSEIEDWIAKGIPVGLSLCYNRLRGKGGPISGHLVVCVGFTKAGDVIVNDPGTRQNVRKTFPRADLVTAWATSKNAAYLIYPEKARLPKDRFGHWDSPTSGRRTAVRD